MNEWIRKNTPFCVDTCSSLPGSDICVKVLKSSLTRSTSCTNMMSVSLCCTVFQASAVLFRNECHSCCVAPFVHMLNYLFWISAWRHVCCYAFILLQWYCFVISFSSIEFAVGIVSASTPWAWFTVLVHDVYSTYLLVSCYISYILFTIYRKYQLKRNWPFVCHIFGLLVSVSMCMLPSEGTVYIVS
jgi:hypothetical protein